jgi:RND superfamily putative drug exporter
VLTSRYGRLVSIFAWIIIPVSLAIIAPSLTEVSSSRQEDFLPVGAQSTKALELREEHFPASGTPGILVYRNQGGLTQKDLNSIEDDFDWLLRRASQGSLGDLTSVFNTPGLRDNLLSEDRSTLMILFSVRASQERALEEVQEEIRAIRKELVEGRTDVLEVWLTGPAGIIEDSVSVFQSIDLRITLFTVVSVLVILLIIYRAPIMALLPLISAGLAYISASGVVGLLAEHTGLLVNAQATSIMVVLIFGAGTDYMLFISSRFKEQLRLGFTSAHGMAETMSKIGPAIFSSALTTVLAMLVLGLATLRSFQVLGPVLALGMTFAIIGGLTFIPAILSLLGRSAYWPTKIEVGSEHSVLITGKGFWAKVGSWVGKRPLFTAGVSVILLCSMSLGVLSLRSSYDLLASLPDDTESVLGYRVMQESFPSGSVYPTDVFLVANGSVIENLEMVELLSSRLAEVSGVSQVISPSRPFGSKPESLVEYQDAINGLAPSVKNKLQSEGRTGILDLVEAGHLGHSQRALASAYLATHERISASGEVARIYVVLENDPGATESLDKIGELRDAADKVSHPEISGVFVGGNTAIQYDTKLANERDVRVIAPIILGIIFVVLVVLVRAIVAPLYLLGSVVLSFLASLGVSVYIFQNLLGHDGVGSGVPIFMFLFLVALGVDYNIYIISRIREESGIHGIRAGTLIAVSSTGSVITSAGVILAATFAALATLPLRDLFQLGFVVSFGVLLDTFFVRGFLVPSLALLLGRWNWWPWGATAPTDSA